MIQARRVRMAKLGTTKRPVRGRVNSEKNAQEILALADERGWKVILEIAPEEPEDLRDIETLMRGARPPGRSVAAGSSTADRQRRNRRKKRKKTGTGKSGLTVLQAARRRALEEEDDQAREAMFERMGEVAADLAPPHIPVRRGTPPDIPLASDVLEQLAQPLVEELAPDDVDGVRGALLFAATVWNAAVLGGGNVDDAMPYLSQLTSEDCLPEPILVRVRELLLRKMRLFPDDNRRIMDVDVELMPSGAMHIVASAGYPAEMWE